jgi:hypothetical protein
VCGIPGIAATFTWIESLFIDTRLCWRYNYFAASKSVGTSLNKETQMTTQHEAIVAAYETYISENEKFSAKGVKASAARARKALQEMSKGIKERRKEITAEKEALATAAK